jgi:RTX calcium-binding nonapeptide repeat (4 copies)
MLRRRPHTARRIPRAAAVAVLAVALATVSVAAPAVAQSVSPLPVTLPKLPLPSPVLPPLATLLPAGLDQVDGVAGTATYDHGLYVHYCPGASESKLRARAARSRPVAVAAHTSWAGWPAKECLKMDKGPAGRSHTLVGLNGVHNWLLGGYGNDTIIGGDHGDVIWGDYHPSGEKFQSATIVAGDGRNVIYANDTRDYVWTGTNPKTVVHAHGPGTSGVIHCESRGIVVYMSHPSRKHFTLDGCRHVSYFSVGY